MTARRLFLSRVAANFDPARDVAAGPWCFVGAENAFEGWEDLPFVDPFRGMQALKEADALTRRLANHLVFDWAERMNRRHGRDYSPTFWRNLTILWLVAAVQVTWRCYRNLELLVDRYRNESLIVRVTEGDPAWSTADVSDFMRLVTLDGHFAFWMGSLLLRGLAPKNWTLEPAPTETDTSRGIPRAAVGRDNWDRNPLGAFIGRLGFDHVTGTKFSRPFFAFLINILPRRPASGKVFGRDEAVLGAFPEGYLAGLQRFLEATLPTDLTDGFAAIEKEAKSYRYAPGRLTVTHASSVNTKFQLINAMAVEAGERVVGFQHGGWYGTAGVESWASESEYVHHAFITWGWSQQGSFYGRMVPLPAPMLAPLRNKHRFRDDQLIFVGTRMFIQNDRFDMRPSATGWIAYRKAKRAFVLGLSGTSRRSLIYRPYHRSPPILEDGAYFTRFFPDVPILEGSLNDHMLRCRLLVLDHPGTTLHLAMAANVPTVCYWQAGDWPLCPQAEVQFELLRQCGILFDSPAAAARHVNAIWSDVPGWWMSAPVQAARRSWAHCHARTSPVWWWHWARALWNLGIERGPARSADRELAKEAKFQEQKS